VFVPCHPHPPLRGAAGDRSAAGSGPGHENVSYEEISSPILNQDKTSTVSKETEEKIFCFKYI